MDRRRNLLILAGVVVATTALAGSTFLIPSAKALRSDGAARRARPAASPRLPTPPAGEAGRVAPAATAASPAPATSAATPGASVPAPGSPPAASAVAQPAPAGPPPAAPAAPPDTTPRRVTGRVVTPAGTPLAGASIAAGGVEIRTGADGTFTVDALAPGAPLVAKMPGYDRLVVHPNGSPVSVTLRPLAVKAAYLTYYGVGDKTIRGRVLDLAARTELNAVVIDVKGDRGLIPYRTEVREALEAGAQGPVIIKDFDGLMADLKARGLYTIARIVVFKDNILAQHRPDLAIIDTRTGKPWVDREKLAWVDPFREEVWSYAIAIAREAVRKGFDEIQFDYVRFPTDGKLASARYSRPNTKDTRLPTIAAFLGRARRELGSLGVYVAADVFGYTAFNENDTDIGQRVEELAPLLDYLSPMVYPSGYHLGIPGYRNPVAAPYQVVMESVRLTRQRSAHAQVVVRPWLQDFRDYAFDRRPFGVAEIRAQIKGAADGGAVGWMLWNPRNDYTGAALRPKPALVAR